MSAEWNHAICDDCWLEQRGNQQPCRAIAPPIEFCCFCGKETTSGIWIRRDPKTLKCVGIHPDALELQANLFRMWRLIRDFTLCETSQTSYAELKGSQSMDIPVEFLALCEFAEEMGVKLP